MNKITRKNREICSYCGRRSFDVTIDHVFEKKINTTYDNEPHIKVFACKNCNNDKYNLAELIDYCAVFDNDLRQRRTNHYGTRQGLSALRTMLRDSVYHPTVDKVEIRATGNVIKGIQKWFAGLNRYCNYDWHFVRPEEIRIYSVHNELSPNLGHMWSQPERLKKYKLPSYFNYDLSHSCTVRSCGKFIYDVRFCNKTYAYLSFPWPPNDKTAFPFLYFAKFPQPLRKIGADMRGSIGELLSKFYPA